MNEIISFISFNSGTLINLNFYENLTNIFSWLSCSGGEVPHSIRVDGGSNDLQSTGKRGQNGTASEFG
jgi:hypothetical protein